MINWPPALRSPSARWETLKQASAGGCNRWRRKLTQLAAVRSGGHHILRRLVACRAQRICLPLARRLWLTGSGSGLCSPASQRPIGETTFAGSLSLAHFRPSGRPLADSNRRPLVASDAGAAAEADADEANDGINKSETNKNNHHQHPANTRQACHAPSAAAAAATTTTTTTCCCDHERPLPN